MKVLWFTAAIFSEIDSGVTGTWQQSLGKLLLLDGRIDLKVIALGNVSAITKIPYKEIDQWIIPNRNLFSSGLPKQQIIKKIVDLVDKIEPDIIHIWGVESFWGLLSSRGYLHKPVLIDMQGLKGSCSKVFHGDLNLSDQLRSYGIKEMLLGNGIKGKAKEYARWAVREHEMIQGNRFFMVQSPWMRAQVNAINSNAMMFDSRIALRECFLKASSWEYKKRNRIFMSTGYIAPFKGLHIVIRAIALLKGRWPDLQLNIAGISLKKGIRQDGYVKWLSQLAKQLGIENNIKMLGPLAGDGVVEKLLDSSMVVIPSFIESYSLALAEAMSLGVPAVVSYTGGTSFLGTDEDTCLFFPPGDVSMCAFQIERLLSNATLCRKLSIRARETIHKYDNTNSLVDYQISIYKQIIAASI